MPPSSETHSTAVSTAAGSAETAACAAASRCWSEDWSWARAASQAAAQMISARSSIRAALCWTAWKLPTGLPNCSRVRTWSTAVSTHHRATPLASAASRVLTTRSTWSGAGGASRSAAPTRCAAQLEAADGAGEVGRLVDQHGGRRTGVEPEPHRLGPEVGLLVGPLVGADQHHLGAGQAQHRGRRALDDPAVAVRGRDEARRSHQRARGALGVRLDEVVARSLLGQAGGDPARHHRGEERAGEQLAPQLFGHDREVGQVCARPATLLGQVDGVQALTDQALPRLRALAGGEVGQAGSRRLDGGSAPRPRRDGVGEVTVLGGEGEWHQVLSSWVRGRSGVRGVRGSGSWSPRTRRWPPSPPAGHVAPARRERWRSTGSRWRRPGDPGRSPRRRR